ncbi:hypothetical protein OIU84_006636 [Salix udensis]|uniref:Uncharacterized protein n=1 Tax=Salix udensis TaxID=889485 RepID=A0AAD6JZ59_9ROSI|nr:hypothetical protein OIU84_006636 [Salix udensis]
MISYLLEDISIDVSTAMLATLSAIFPIMFWLGWSSFTRSTERSSSLPPGPRGFPFIGNLASLEPDIHSYFAKLAHTHGPIFKLRLGCKLGIVVSSPSLAAEVLRDHDINFANRDIPDVSRAMDYGRSNIVATPVRSRVEDAEKSMRHQDAQHRHLGFSLPPSLPGSSKHRRVHLQPCRVADQRGRPAFSNRVQCRNKHAMGRHGPGEKTGLV